MTWKHSLVAAIVALWWHPVSIASAEVRNFDVTAGPKCTAGAVTEAEPTKVVINVSAASGLAMTEWVATGTLATGTATKADFASQVTAGPLTATFEFSTLKSQSEIAVSGKANGTSVSCGSFKIAAATAAEAGTKASSADTSKDQAAALWLTSPEGGAALEALRGTLRKQLGLTHVAILPHLPSGSVAPLYPASVPETDDLQLAFVVDQNDVTNPLASISDVVCPERDGLRIDGDLKEPAAAVKAQSSRVTEPKFKLVPLGKVLECGAGDVKYQVQLKNNNVAQGNPVQASIKLRPVYQLAATFAVGFDSAKPPSYSVADKKVKEDRDVVGPKVYAGFIWYPAGIDYDHVTGAQHLAPFVFFDPKSISDNFVTGLAWTAKGRISVPVGLSVHRLKVPDGTSVGADFSGDGNVKTKADGFNKKSLGLFVGVSFRAADFLRVKKAVSGS